MMDSDQQLDDEPIVMAHWVPPATDNWAKPIRPVTIFQLYQAQSSSSCEGEFDSEGVSSDAVSTSRC